MHKLYPNYVHGRIIPTPQSFEYGGDGCFRLTDGCRFEVESPFTSAEVHRTVEPLFGMLHAVPELICRTASSDLPEDGYTLTTMPEVCKITASSLSGLRNAVKTLLLASEPERGVAKSLHRIVPCVTVRDFPAMKFRGIHFCIFPETPLHELEKRIRLAALYKYNYAVIESWGVIRLDSHPEFCWDEYAIPKSEITRLVHAAADMGLTLIPQLNIFGHASASRSRSGKHVLLDKHPEYGPLFEPDGWTWCLSNPETRKYLSEMVEELCELYGNPPYFHIGCDESYNAASCQLCKDDYGKKMLDHLMYFHDLLAKHGARVMMWHDMLIESGKWPDEVANGLPEIGCLDILTQLPKDIVICDWQYDLKNGEAPEWKSFEHFQKAGFDVLPCPWNQRKTISSQCDYIVKNGLPGLLETTWHTTYMSSDMLVVPFIYTACRVWNPNSAPLDHVYQGEYMSSHLRMIGHAMGLQDYKSFGRLPVQLIPGSCF